MHIHIHDQKEKRTQSRPVIQSPFWDSKPGTYGPYTAMRKGGIEATKDITQL